MIHLENFGINSCNHKELSEIIYDKKKDVTLFPQHYYEDYFCEVLDDYEVKGNEVDNLLRIKEEMYSAQVWYPCIEKFTIPSTFAPLNKKFDIHKPVFVKLDTVSAKDVHNGIFNSYDEMYVSFQRSPRIQAAINYNAVLYPPCYFIRDVYTCTHEMRCFVYHGKLNAVSHKSPLTQKQKQGIIIFIDEVCKYLPYQNAVIDIAENNSTQLIVIEINEFGGESYTCASSFNWSDDYYILYQTQEYRHVIFRN